MATATAIPTELDHQIMEALDNCITKMSNHLKQKFNPEEKESRSLFRLFCSAINARSKMMSKILRVIEKANQCLKKSGQSPQSNLENIPSTNENSSGLTGNGRNRGRAGAFWRNKKLA